MIRAPDGREVRVVMVAAVSENLVLGRRGALPWRLPDDLKHFRALTLDHPVIMGRKTYETLPGPLDRRVNIVMTRRPTAGMESRVICVHSMHAALTTAARYVREPQDRVFVVGGAEVYREALPFADEQILSRVHLICGGDAWYPIDFYKDFERKMVEVHPVDDRHAVGFAVERWVRRGLRGGT